MDAAGRWVALVPESEPEPELLRLCGGTAAAQSDPNTAARAAGEFTGWIDTGATPTLAPIGSPFRQGVWAALLRIQRGQTKTYGDLAHQLGCRSAQAIGGAVGANPVGLFIPCHRVTAAGGALGGYAWGSSLKTSLLRLEHAPLFYA